MLIPAGKQQITEAILGPLLDETVAWQTAAETARKQLDEKPDDLWQRFNLAIALYQTGNYRDSVDAFAHVEARLLFRTLWYQIEPLYSYQDFGLYDDVFSRRPDSEQRE